MTAAPAGYEIVKPLGRGGMGVVYQARQVRLDRLVAVKFLSEDAGGDSAFAERFQREARALARLNHSNIVTIFDFGQVGGQSYIVMELVEGTSLRAPMQAGRLDAHECLRIIDAITDALEYAHEQGIVHRDIKPENILLDRRGRVKVADFGLAKLLAPATRDIPLTGTGHLLGTLRYMAPEQFDDPANLDQRADVYSLGVVVYEMLTGELPLGRFPAPSETAGVDSRWDGVVLRSLQRSPAQRYQSVREMRAALAKIAVLHGQHHVAAARLADLAPPSQLPESDKHNDPAAHNGVVTRFLREGNVKGDDDEDAAIASHLTTLGVTLLLMCILGLLGTAITLWATFSSTFPTDVSDARFRIANFLWLSQFLLVPAASCLVLGGVGALSQRRYAPALVASLAAIVPLTASWVLMVIPGVRLLVALLNPRTQASFFRQVERDAQTRIREPAGLLMVTSILGLAASIAVTFLAAPVLGFPWIDVFQVQGFLLAGPVFLLTIAGAGAMLSGRRRWLALAGSIAASLPLTFGWFITVVPGLWTLLTLVKAEPSQALRREPS